MSFEFKKPVVGITVVFISGLIFSQYLNIKLFLLFFLLFVVFVLMFCLHKKKIIFELLIIFFFFLFGIVWFKVDKILPSNHFYNVVGDIQSKEVKVYGVIISEPEVSLEKTSFYLKVKRIELDDFTSNNLYGDILVKLGFQSDVSYGDELELTGYLSSIKVNYYSKLRSYFQYLLNRKIYYILRLNKYCEFKVIGQKKGNKFKSFAIYFKNKINKIIFDNVRGVSVGVIQAMVLGDKKAVPKVIYDDMIKTGTVHILVVSGFNVGIVAYLINLILKFFRFNRIVRFVCIVVCLFLYCLLTGACVPVVRATIMAVFIGLSYFVQKENDIVNALSLAALVILLVNPNFIFDVGFLLSFSCVLALGWFYPILVKIFGLDSINIKLIKNFLQVVLSSLSVWLFTFLIVLLNFKLVSWISVLANIFIPFIATLITICVFGMVLFSFISSYMAYTFASVCEVLVAILLYLNAILLKIPYAYITF